MTRAKIAQDRKQPRRLIVVLGYSGLAVLAFVSAAVTYALLVLLGR